MKVKDLVHGAFEGVYAPGETPPSSRIYCCIAGGDEVTSTNGNPLPPQNDHQHARGLGPIRWRLLVYAETR